MVKLDQTDLKILEALQRDATISTALMAELVGASQSPTWRRMSNLEETGVIKRKVAIIDRRAVGLNFMVHVLVRLKDQTQRTVDLFRASVLDIPEVVQCHMLMGDIDFLLLVITVDLDAFHKILREKISIIHGISGIDSRVVVEESKSTTQLPIAVETEAIARERRRSRRSSSK